MWEKGAFVHVAEPRAVRVAILILLLLIILVCAGCGGVGGGGGSAATTSAPTNNPPPVGQTVPASPSSIAQLSVFPSAIDFGQVRVGTSTTRNMTVSNAGAASGTINSASLNGSGFRLATTSFPITVPAGGSINLAVLFDPSSTGASTGSLSLAASNPATVSVALAGSAVSATVATVHSVVLSWAPSLSSVDGYFIYKSTQGGGPYTRMNSAPTPISSFSDSGVVGGQTYFYVVTAVAGSVESSFSNETMAVIPTP